MARPRAKTKRAEADTAEKGAAEKAVYRTVDPRVWNDDRFLGLSDNGRLLFLALLTGPYTQRFPGLVLGGAGTLSDLMRWGVEETVSALGELSDSGMVEVDAKHLLIRLPNAPRYQRPDNPKHLAGWVPGWLSLPESKLKYKQALEVKRVIESKPWGASAWASSFGPLVEADGSKSAQSRDGMRNGSGNRMPYQEQEQEQEQEQFSNTPPGPPPAGGAESAETVRETVAACAATEPEPSAKPAADPPQADPPKPKPKRTPAEVHPDREAVCERLLPVWVETWGLDGQRYRVTNAWRQAVRLAMDEGYEEHELDAAIRGSAQHKWLREDPRRAKISWILRVTKDSRDNPTDNVERFRDAHLSGPAPSSNEAISKTVYERLKARGVFNGTGPDGGGGERPHGADDALQADVLDAMDVGRPDRGDGHGGDGDGADGGRSPGGGEGDRALPPAPDGEGEEGGPRDAA